MNNIDSRQQNSYPSEIAIYDFHGGIHPPENKIQSLGSPIQQLPIPPLLVLPCAQHIGAPAQPVVSVGDKVLKGQLVAEAVGPVSVPVHASSSGTVVAIEDRPIAHASGLSDVCIVIETDGLDQWQSETHDALPSTEIKQILDHIREAGIAGMGGAGFPASIKLNTGTDKPIETLIINGTECEPFITADHALMIERADSIATGIEILAELIQPRQILVGIEDNKPDGIEAVKKALSKHPFDVAPQVVVFPTKYPSGGEKQLIEILTGKQVPSGGLPADIGIVCQNMGTTVAIDKAVRRGEPLISRVTTVTGAAVGKPGNYDVLIGTPIEFLLQHTDTQLEDISRLIMGGPMMGFALQNTAAPIVKASNCILATTEEELPTPPPAQACIRCGMCAEACPVSLLPQQLYWFAQGKELEKLESHNIADCIECGACSYVCPSNIPLVQYYRASKAEIRQRKIDHQHAEHSRARFEARQDRLQRLNDEKVAARKARQQAAKTANAGKPPPSASTDTSGAAGSASISNPSVENTKENAQQSEKAATVQAAIERVNAKKTAQQNETVDTDDPVAKALARRAAQQAEDAADPEAKLVRAVESAEKRLAKARQKLSEAQSSNDENLPAFEKAVQKSESKLETVKAELEAFRQNPSQDSN